MLLTSETASFSARESNSIVSIERDKAGWSTSMEFAA